MKIKSIKKVEPRVGYPDIDSDFGKNPITDVSKDTIIDYLKEKYGHDHVIPIGTKSSYSPASVVRDMAKVLNIPYSESLIYQKMIDSKVPIEESIKGNSELKEWFAQYPKLLLACKHLSGSLSSYGTHAGGVFISDKKFPISYYCGVQKPPKKDDNANPKISTIWDKNEIEQLGFIKYDLLGLDCASQIHICKQLTKSNPYEDYPEEPEVYKNIIGNYKNGNLFQFTGDLGKRFLVELQPMSLIEMSNASALIRNMQNESGRKGYERYVGNVQDVRANGNSENSIWHKELRESVLEDRNFEIAKKHIGYTYGINIYQEQIAMLVIDLSDGKFDFNDGNFLRKGLDKQWQKIGVIDELQGNEFQLRKWHKQFMVLMNEFVLPFIGRDGWGNPDETVRDFLNCTLYDKDGKKHLPIPETGVLSWFIIASSYSFSILHSQAYSINTYNQMYQKHHHSLQFWLSSFLCSDNVLKKIGEYIQGVKFETDDTIKILAPSINNSGTVFLIEGNDIRYSLSAIKSVGAIASREIIDNRDEHGKFTSIKDFVTRFNHTGSKVNKTVVANLILTNAFAEFGTVHEVWEQFFQFGFKVNTRIDPKFDDFDELCNHEFLLLGGNLSFLNPILEKIQDCHSVSEMYDKQIAKVCVKIITCTVKETKVKKKPYVALGAICQKSGKAFTIYSWNNVKLKPNAIRVINLKKADDFYSLVSVFDVT